MFTFLNQRYGLKQLILEWASSIVSAIKQYSDQDTEISLFGKILRNTVDEEYWQVHGKAKLALQELLQLTVKEKQPSKQTEDIIKFTDEVI